MDHVGDFNNKLGLDIYLNPWWGLKTAFSKDIIYELNKNFGEPDLWFNQMYHELLWGSREIDRIKRPRFCVNLSGTNGIVWRTFYLPWNDPLIYNDVQDAYNQKREQKQIRLHKKKLEYEKLMSSETLTAPYKRRIAL